MSKIIKKKILTEDDLLNFCEEQKFIKFNSIDTGYQLALKVPTSFEIDNSIDENHRGMMRLKFRIFHTGLNRNKSYVSRESAEKAMNTIADRPVLAAIHQLDDGTWDFEGHEMEIVKDDKGNEELKYIESQVGSFSSEPAFWEHDDKLNKDYVCAYAYISEEYTKACEIIRSKQGSKNSCELFIDELSYNAKEKYLELNDFYVNASTLLGSRDDGTEIQEGMEGSRADIADFSVKNNSIKFDKDKKLIELLENLNKTLSNFNNKEQFSAQQIPSKEGGNEEEMNKFEELLKKYNISVEDVTFEYSELSDEELEAKFKETFEDDSTEPSGDEGETDDTNDDESTSEPEEGETSDESASEPEEQTFEKMVRSFEISHEDIRYALYNLLGSYESTDDDWYYITSVYDTYFVYENWRGDKIYGQKYTKENDNVAFDGERYTLHKEYLTDSEYAEINDMRSNYAAIKEELSKYQNAEIHAQKEAIVSDEKYSVLTEKDEDGNFKNEAYAKLVSEMDNYSLTDLEKELKSVFADYITSGGQFAFNGKPEEKPVVSQKKFAAPAKDDTPSRYGNLFK